MDTQLMNEIICLEKTRDLTNPQLEALLFKLNRIRYTLEEQDGFIRSFLLVHSALVASRKENS